MSVKILLNGAGGKMGRAISEIAHRHDVSISAVIDIGDKTVDYINKCDVIVDFSYHTVTPELAKVATKHGKPLIIGTTGHSDDERSAILEHINHIAIVWAGNFSVGVNLLNYLTKKTAGILTNDYNPEIIETHHRHKKDAPSGTAQRLAEIIRQTRKLSIENERHGRTGEIGERPDNEIGIHAVRGGDVVGEHTVMFIGSGERIELTHKATDRRIFAEGALQAAHWAMEQEPGLYDMQDVLDLKD